MGGVARGLLVAIIVTTVSLLFTSLDIYHLGIVVAVVTLDVDICLPCVASSTRYLPIRFDDISIVPTFVLTPLTYLGGVFYSLDLLPEFWANVSRANPLVYVVNAFRYGVLRGERCQYRLCVRNDRGVCRDCLLVLHVFAAHR